MAKIASRTEIRCVNGHAMYRLRHSIDELDPIRPQNLDEVDQRVVYAPGIALPTCPICNSPVFEVSPTHGGIRIRSDAQRVADGAPGGGTALRIAGTRGEVPRGTLNVTAQYVEYMNRVAHRLAFDCTHLGLIYCGYSRSSTAVVTPLGNGYAIESGLEIGGVGGRLPWGGSDVGAVASGDLLKATDLVPASAFGLQKFTKGTDVFSRSLFKVSASQNHLRSADAVSARGEGAYFAGSGLGGSVTAIGTLTTPGGGLTQTVMATPLAIVGLRASGGLALMLLGDSLKHGWTDPANGTTGPGDGSTNGGYSVRGAWNIDGAGTPAGWMRQTYPGTTAAQWATAGSLSALAALWPYVDGLDIGLGTNDGNSGATPATVLSNLLAIAQSAKDGGVQRRSATLIIPRRGSSNSFIDVAGQQASATFGAGGTFRDPFNASILAAVGGSVLTGALNINPAVEDQSNPSFWVTNGVANYATSDGVHPSSVVSTVPTVAAAAIASAHYAAMGSFT